MSRDVREPFVLEVGVEVDGVVHREGTLRPATLADSYAAAALVEVPADIAKNRALGVAYQMAIDDAQILCQVVTLGDLDPPPAVTTLIAAIDPDDMAILRGAAAAVKKKRKAASAG